MKTPKTSNSPVRGTMKDKGAQGAGYRPVQNAPQVTITPKAKTGGMVNSNSKVSATKKVKGKVGGISKAPKTVVPKAKYGMSMRKK